MKKVNLDGNQGYIGREENRAKEHRPEERTNPSMQPVYTYQMRKELLSTLTIYKESDHE